MTGDCRRCRAWLRREPGGSAAESEAHQRHLSACAACRRAHEQQEALLAALAPPPPPAPPEGMAERIMLRLEAEGCWSPALSTGEPEPARPLWLRMALVGVVALLCLVSAQSGAVGLLQFWLAAARWQTKVFCTEVGVRDSLAFLLLLEVAWLAGWLAWREWLRYRQHPTEGAC